MPAGERIADWVTWNLFFFALPRAAQYGRCVLLHVIQPERLQSFHQMVYDAAAVAQV
jgi:hypothetical protein